jgi:predicted RNase H-like HicB family nuclease
VAAYRPSSGKLTMATKKVFVEQRADGKYRVLTPKAKKASAVTKTQEEAIARAKQLFPEATVEAERVRDVGPGRDKWRKT